MAYEIDLSGRVALVTGASSGLGASFAKTLARAGAGVVLAARRVERLKTLRAEIESEGGDATFTFTTKATAGAEVPDELDGLDAMGSAEGTIGSGAGDVIDAAEAAVEEAAREGESQAGAEGQADSDGDGEKGA